MRIRVLGGGFYGCHIALSLMKAGHQVQLHESAPRLFAGASGAIPARLHQGFHYPRSGETRAACRAHNAEFMAAYGQFTRSVPVNIYAIAEHDSLIDFQTYKKVMSGEAPFIEIYDPAEFGLVNVQGALLTGERHVVVDDMREFFAAALNGKIRYKTSPVVVDDPRWDLTVDATFCALDDTNVDRYEPCLTALLEGRADKAVTVMDGFLPSIYPWDERRGLSSLTSSSLTPFSKTCKTWHEARAVLRDLTHADLCTRAEDMLTQIGCFWPEARDEFRAVDFRTSIRAMPRSRADSRLVDVASVGNRAVRVRAGKIDAIFSAERLIKSHIERMSARPRRRARAS